MPGSIVDGLEVERRDGFLRGRDAEGGGMREHESPTRRSRGTTAWLRAIMNVQAGRKTIRWERRASDSARVMRSLLTKDQGGRCPFCMADRGLA